MAEIYSQSALNFLGEIVQASMRLDGLSLAAFAKLTGTHKTTIERLTKGEVKDPVPVLRKIAKYIHLVDLEPQQDGLLLISKVHLRRYYQSWRDLESILESQSGKVEAMTTYCAVTQRIRDAIARKGLDPNDDAAIEQFARCGPWSKNLDHLKNIVLGRSQPSYDDAPAIAYTLEKFTGEVVSPDEIANLLVVQPHEHEHKHEHEHDTDCVTH